MKKSLTRTAFALVPIELLEKFGDKKGAIVVYCWLWHYAGRDDQAFPSVERLAAECRMKPDGVRACLKSLAAEGWISRINRAGQTTLFHVRSERVNPSPKWGTPPPNGGSPEQGSTPLPQMGDPTPPPNGGPNNKHLTRTTYQEVLEPPLPPKGERRDKRVETHPYRDRDGFMVNPDQQPHATEAQPQPTQPVKPWEGPNQPPQPQAPPEPQTSLAHTTPVDPQSQKRKAGFTPTAADVPAALLPVVLELLEFWPTRSGAKTQRAWRLMLTDAERIQCHANGGTEILRQQLRKGIKHKDMKGKGWISLDFDNWLNYGTKAGTSIGGTGFNRKPTTMESVTGAVELIRQRAAAQAAEEQSALLVVEVA